MLKQSIPTPRREGTRMLLFAMLGLGCVACTDSNPLMRPDARPTEHMTARYECEADLVAGTLICRQNGPRTGGASAALLGQNQIKMASANLVSDTVAQTMEFDATVQNLLTYSIGTPDGTTRTGVKVFFESGPTVTAYKAPGDTGTVLVDNEDGQQSFTAANQPYFLYDTILAPQQTSAPRRWRYHVPRTVSRFSFVVRAFAFTPPEQKVALHAPNGWLISADSVAKLYAFSSTVLSHPRLAGPYPRSLILVGFQAQATLEERQSAVDMVKGRVVGGMGQDYVVVIAASASADPLWAAIDKLRALPQVHHADPEVFTQGLSVSWMRPNDGAGWALNDWALVVDSAGGANWAAEAVAAPFGWGCETGADTARVAVVDVDPQHGGRVRSVIDTPSDDGADIAGLMWDGTVTMHVSATLLPALEAAFVDSADVVNLSVGITYLDSAASAAAGHPVRRLPQNTLADINRAQNLGNLLATRLQAFESAYGIQPLYVLAAGNYQAEASFSGFPQIVNDAQLGARVLVVGASSLGNAAAVAARNRPLWANSGDPLNPGSSFGTLLNITAPGGDIQLMDAGVPSITSGTSYAAPMVAAAAGLLKSFDPRLTAAEIRTLLLDGANRGGWQGGGIRHLNIYEALKSAARRAGAPMCGQRYWLQGNTFTLQRDSASDTRETLFTLSNGLWAGGQNVMHGGKHINFYNGNDGTEVDYRWTPGGGWAPGAPDGRPYPQPGSNAATLSRDLTSHDRDLYMSWDLNATATNTSLTVEVYDSTWNVVRTFTPVTLASQSSPQECTQRFVSVHPDDDARLRGGDSATATVYLDYLDMKAGQPCERWTSGPGGVSRIVRGAFSPRGEAVYAFVGRNLSSTSYTAWAPCGKEGYFYGPGGAPAGGFEARVNMECRGWSATSGTGDTEVWRFDIATGNRTQLGWGATGTRLGSPSIRESLRELTVEVDSIHASQSGSWSGSGYQWTHTATTPVQTRTCRVEFRNLATGAVEFAPPISCRASGGDAGISASRRGKR